MTSETEEIKTNKETIKFMQKCQYLYKIIDNYWGKHNLPKLTPIKTESLSKPISRNKGFKFLLHKFLLHSPNYFIGKYH